MAIITRWFMPPESWCGNARKPRLRRGNADLLAAARSTRSRTARRVDLHDARASVSAICQPTVIARVQRGHRLLEHHRHVLADQPAALRAATVPADRCRRSAARPRARGPGSRSAPSPRASTTLLPEPDSPTMPTTSPASSVEVEPIHGAEHAARGRELDGQVADFEQRHQRFSLGSSASRSPSPNRLKASTVSRIARPGNASTHQARW